MAAETPTPTAIGTNTSVLFALDIGVSLVFVASVTTDTILLLEG